MRLGMSATERDKFIKKQELPIFDGSQEYCLWLGCMGAYDPQGREIIASFAKVMQYLGTSFGVLKKEKCTGDPVRRLGNDLVFQQLAEQNLEILKQQKVTKIVTICPHCVRTIAKDWKEYGASPEIEHHSEFMARYQDKLPKTDGPDDRLPRSLLSGPLSRCPTISRARCLRVPARSSIRRARGSAPSAAERAAVWLSWAKSPASA